MSYFYIDPKNSQINTELNVLDTKIMTILKAMGRRATSNNYKRMLNRKEGYINIMYKQALVVLEAEKR